MSTPQASTWDDEKGCFSSLAPTTPPPVSNSSPLNATAGEALVLGRAIKVSGTTGKASASTGVMVGAGDDTLGICGLAAAADGAPTTIFTTGMRATVPGLTAGKLYRGSNGALVSYASIGSGDVTQAMGFYDAANSLLYVNIGTPEQKP